MGFFHRHRGLTPYLLLAPGVLWLSIFFVVPLGFLNLAGEDFAHYMERIPGCFLRIGAREAGGPVIPAHSPVFYPAEESLFVGAAVLAECARVASRELATGSSVTRQLGSSAE